MPQRAVCVPLLALWLATTTITTAQTVTETTTTTETTITTTATTTTETTITTTATTTTETTITTTATTTTETTNTATTTTVIPACSGSFSVDEDLATAAGVVRALELVTDGATKLVAAGGEDQVLRVWTLVTSTPAAAPNLLRGHGEAIWALEWISDHSVLASASGDGTIRFWPLATLTAPQSCSASADCCDGDGLGCQGEHVVSWRDAGMAGPGQVHSLVWVASEGLLVSAWDDTVLRTWRYLGAGSNPSWSHVGQLQAADRVYAMAWLPAGSRLATASPDWPQPQLWDSLSAGTGAYLSEPTGHVDAILAVAADPSGATLATGSIDTSIVVWDVATNLSTARLSGHTHWVTSLTWLHSETKLASGSKDGNIKLWDMRDTQTDQTSSGSTLAHHSGRVNALLWISDGQLISGGADGKVTRWTCTR